MERRGLHPILSRLKARLRQPSLARYATCMLCAGQSRLAWCEPCHRDMLAEGTRCERCALPTQTAGLCGRCLCQPPAFDLCRVLYSYRPPGTSLIHQYKYRALDALAGSFAEYFQTAALPSDIVLPQALLPVPLHWSKQMQRGFNQSQWFARQLSARLDIPCQDRVLRRRRRTVSQASLPRAARLANLRGAFELRSRLDAPHIALIDDVLTTGATAHEAARVLKRRGAKTVELWVIARADGAEP